MLGDGVVVGAVVVGSPVVGGLVKVVVGAGATGSVVVALLLGGGLVVVTAVDVVGDVGVGFVPPPPLLRSAIT
jgi:hypothetical protein